jgi:uncharacterized protein YpbB
MKKYLLEGLTGKFDVGTWHQRKRDFVLPQFSINAYAGVSQQKTDSPHPLLYQQLRKLRDNICSRKDIPVYMVAGSSSLDEMARYLPQTLAELKKISGFGDTKVGQYGKPFLDVIVEYAKENSLSSLIHEKSPKREKKESNVDKKKKVDTKTESYKLYSEGMKVNEIAKARSLTVQTIEGHLAYYVSKGIINIEELVSREKILLIEPVIKDMKGVALNQIREKFGNDIGFGEIKLVVAWHEYQSNVHG